MSPQPGAQHCSTTGVVAARPYRSKDAGLKIGRMFQKCMQSRRETLLEWTTLAEGLGRFCDIVKRLFQCPLALVSELRPEFLVDPHEFLLRLCQRIVNIFSLEQLTQEERVKLHIRNGAPVVLTNAGSCAH